MDTDSFIMHVDNYVLKCTNNGIDHFVMLVTDLYGHTMKATGGKQLKVQGEGAICWAIQDGNGVSHHIYVKGALYMSKSTVYLLSPQHWGQSEQDHFLREMTYGARLHQKSAPSIGNKRGSNELYCMTLSPTWQDCAHH
eukprot:3904779-Ditylum_brightwellii.AAC.1